MKILNVLIEVGEDIDHSKFIEIPVHHLKSKEIKEYLTEIKPKKQIIKK